MSPPSARYWILSQAAFGMAGLAGHAWLPMSDEARCLDETVVVQIGAHRFKVDIAESEQDQIAGLGGRERVAPDTGMLFLMPTESYQSFSMRDCAIPLDLIYVDRHGKVASIHEMHPEPARTDAERADDSSYVARLKGYVSEVPVSVAIELSGGRAAELGIREGDTVLIPYAR